jgi:FtsP/CotA-like multicopper oxidase with cupredoxin domain
MQYNISVREFLQQILPAPLSPTPVWGYGLAEDPVPAVAPVPATQSTFHYPAFTVEATSGVVNTVRWINELVAIDPATGLPCDGVVCPRTFRPHVLKNTLGTGTVIDRSLHWANPEQAPCTVPTTTGTDCAPDPTNPLNQVGGSFDLSLGYPGPVPLVTHLHGAHVNARSDGYPESWYLPDAVLADGVTPISMQYVTRGTQFNQFFGGNNVPASTAFHYENTQPAANLWFHDHTLGITRSNVYAGLAGFWMIRGGAFDGATDGVTGLPAVLPGQAGVVPGFPGRPSDPRVVGGCDPNFDLSCRFSIREIPLVIQAKAFNADGTLFYPDSRDFFTARPTHAAKTIPFIPTTNAAGQVISDIAPIWNPEFFGNTIVVNGKTWPKLEVLPQRYRLRMVNGSDSRFLNLALYTIPDTNGAPRRDAFTINNNVILNHVAAGIPGWQELPFYQIGGDNSFLEQVVEVRTGFATPLPGNGTIPAPVPNQDPTGAQALLLGLAERADVIVDFSLLPVGTVVRMINTGPDAPFGGFPVAVLADPRTTGEIMSFVVSNGPFPIGVDPSTPAQNLVLNAPPAIVPTPAERVRPLSLNEQLSGQICVRVSPNGTVTRVVATLPAPPLADAQIIAVCAGLNAVPFGPKAALLGTFDPMAGLPTPLRWVDAITEAPLLNTTEIWEFWNFTVDSHPIHIHQVAFDVLNRELFDPLTGTLIGPPRGPEVTELSAKDTVIAYPGEVTRVRAWFDIPGLYVWHCHILSHEDHEMMRPFCVKSDSNQTTCPGAPGQPVPIVPGA